MKYTCGRCHKEIDTEQGAYYFSDAEGYICEECFEIK